MLKTSNTKKRMDQVIEIESLDQLQNNKKNIHVIENQARNMVELKIYGEIDEPEAYLNELSLVNSLAAQYQTIEITLNSPGGSLNTTVDLAASIKKYQYIITIGKGEVASAAFMLWTMGDLKVVTDYSMYMAHRESYGMYGKTSEHKDTAIIFGAVYEKMFNECFSTILTTDEQRIAERSEAWVSYSDLAKRKGVITYDAYMRPKNPYMVSDLIITEAGEHFLYDQISDTYKEVFMEFGEKYIRDMDAYLYGLVDIEKPRKKKKKNKKK